MNTTKLQTPSWPTDNPPGFGDTSLLELLDRADLLEFDGLTFGLITMDRRARVIHYNTAESRFSGLRPGSVLGKDMFLAVAPCTNNFMVAERFRTRDVLDDIIDYVFTFRMRPTAVRLRLMAAEKSPRQYLAVQAK